MPTLSVIYTIWLWCVWAPESSQGHSLGGKSQLLSFPPPSAQHLYFLDVIHSGQAGPRPGMLLRVPGRDRLKHSLPISFLGSWFVYVQGGNYNSRFWQKAVQLSELQYREDNLQDERLLTSSWGEQRVRQRSKFICQNE